jgi:1-acyl-sn-glycerol-3-phosphate acyltransferase
MLHAVLPAGRGTRLGQRGIQWGFHLYLTLMARFGLFRCDLSALDQLNAEAPTVIIANHPSVIDAVLVVSRLRRVTCIAKTSLARNPLLGGGIRLAGYIYGDAPLTTVRQAVACLRAGSHLLIFPEGSRTGTAPVDPFKAGFALMAGRAGVPVQTVFLESNTRYLSKGWSPFRAPRLPLAYRARLGRRFDVPPETAAFVAALEAYFARELRDATPPAA